MKSVRNSVVIFYVLGIYGQIILFPKVDLRGKYWTFYSSSYFTDSNFILIVQKKLFSTGQHLIIRSN